MDPTDYGLTRRLYGVIQISSHRVLRRDVETPGVRSIAVVSVTADVIKPDGSVERQEIRIPVAASLEGEGREEPEIRRTQVLLAAAKARDEARKRGRDGDFGGAANVLREAKLACMTVPGMEEQVEDLGAMASKYEHHDVSASDEKYLYQRAYNARRGKAMYEDKISRSRKPGNRAHLAMLPLCGTHYPNAQ